MCQTYRPLRSPLERNGLDGQPGLLAHISQYTYLEPPTSPGRTYRPEPARWMGMGRDGGPGGSCREGGAGGTLHGKAACSAACL